jgi:hypothetical protein
MPPILYLGVLLIRIIKLMLWQALSSSKREKENAGG